MQRLQRGHQHFHGIRAAVISHGPPSLDVSLFVIASFSPPLRSPLVPSPLSVLFWVRNWSGRNVVARQHDTEGAPTQTQQDWERRKGKEWGEGVAERHTCRWGVGTFECIKGEPYLQRVPSLYGGSKDTNVTTMVQIKQGSGSRVASYIPSCRRKSLCHIQSVSYEGFSWCACAFAECMQVCEHVFYPYSDSGSHLWFEDWWRTQLRCHFCGISSWSESPGCLQEVQAGTAEYAQQWWCPVYEWYRNWCVMRCECTDHHVSFSLSAHHTRMHNRCMSEYLQNRFRSHCALMTLKGKTKSGTWRGRWTFCTFCDPVKSRNCNKPRASGPLQTTDQPATSNNLFPISTLRYETSNNWTTNQFSLSLIFSNYTISPGLYCVKPFHGSWICTWISQRTPCENLPSPLQLCASESLPLISDSGLLQPLAPPLNKYKGYLTVGVFWKEVKRKWVVQGLIIGKQAQHN